MGAGGRGEGGGDVNGESVNVLEDWQFDRGTGRCLSAAVQLMETDPMAGGCVHS